MDAPMYIADKVIPSALAVIEPRQFRLSLYPGSGEDLFSTTPQQACASRMLDAASDLFSKWFMVMKSAISRERARERLRMEEEGISLSSKAKYERPLLTSSEESIVKCCHDMSIAMFSNYVAEYAMLKFQKALDTGDKRSFKIRLLVLKARDSLKNTPLYEGFSFGVDECIANAEKKAGCIPDPSPRRMSHAEKAKAVAKRNRPVQTELFDSSEYANEYDIQDPTPTEDVDNAVDNYVNNLLNVHDNSNVCEENEKYNSQSVACPSGKHWENIGKDHHSTSEYKNKKIIKDVNNVVNKSDYIEKKDVTVTCDSHGMDGSSVAQHKLKRYTSVSEISSDIDSGKLNPYKKDSDIINDLKNGSITPEEAVLFMSELVKRIHPSYATHIISDKVSKDMDSKINKSSEDQVAYRGRFSSIESDEEVLDEEEEIDGMPDDCPYDGDDRGYSISDAEYRPDDNW